MKETDRKELFGLTAIMIIGLIACLCIASAIIQGQ
jgi:hypothetical protein|tara:strand:- start:821 stop:925 length:105 start_codon:yes stop_codon:yes gene_type:complete